MDHFDDRRQYEVLLDQFARGFAGQEQKSWSQSLTPQQTSVAYHAVDQRHIALELSAEDTLDVC
jgi:hypothetical protein